MRRAAKYGEEACSAACGKGAVRGDNETVRGYNWAVRREANPGF